MKRDNVKTFCAAGLVVAGLVGLAFGTPYSGWVVFLGAVVLLDC